MGRIPDGLFDFIDSTIRVLAGPQQSVDGLRRLQLVIEDARRTKADPRQVVAAVEEQIPSLGGLIHQLLIPRNAGEFYAFLGVLLTAIVLVQTLREQPGGVTNVNVDRQVVQVIEDCWGNGPQEPPSHPPSDTEQKPAQNNKPGKPNP